MISENVCKSIEEKFRFAIIFPEKLKFMSEGE